MNSSAQTTPPAFDLLEEAVHLLRLAPWRCLLLYYLGSVPFVLGMLYFYTDMSLSAFAAEHSAQAAFSLACLFVWMQFWHAVFAARLHASLLAEGTAGWSWRRYAVVLMLQTAVAPWAWLLLLLSAVLLLPWTLAVAFFHNLSVLGNGADASLRTLCATAYQQARLWPRQNLLLFLVLSALRLCGLVNIGATLALLPYLLKMLLGIETVFSRHMDSLLNTTFVLTAWSMTSLGIGPLCKAVYVVRCFYGESLHSGADLRATLQSLRLARATSVVLGVWVMLVSPPPCAMAQAAEPPPATDLTPQLNRAIDAVLQQREYIWRQPRSQAEPPALLLFPEVATTLKTWFKTLAKWFQAGLDWLRERWFKPRLQGPPGVRDASRATLLLWGTVGVLLVLCLVLAWRLWYRRSGGLATVVPQALTAMPVLDDERVTADVLPAQEWGKMAQHFGQQGEWRLAIRALHLASLAYLAQQHLLTIAAAKSNREYARELGRKAHSRPQLLAAFAQNISTFERVWYGTHTSNAALLHEFQHAYEQIRAAADA